MNASKAVSNTGLSNTGNVNAAAAGEGGMPKWLVITLQIVAALVIILVLYIVTLYVLNIDSIVINTGSEVKAREETVLIDGYAGPSYMYDLDYNTINPMVDNFRKIGRAANSAGGASFTYQFWIKVEEANDELFRNLILFVKGDKKSYNLATYEKVDTTGSSYKIVDKFPPSIYVTCPMIYFGKSYREIRVRYNSNNRVYNEVIVNMSPDGEPTSRKNIMSLLPLNWTLLTFVFEDNYSLVANAENGIKFTMYVNDVPYWIESASSTPIMKNDFLKQNDGNIHFMPNLKVSTEFVKVGNFKYFNYPVQQHEVKSTYLKGPPSYAASKVDKYAVKPSYISALNKLDIVNY